MSRPKEASPHDRGYVDRFPSLRWPQLRRVLTRSPLNYQITSEEGSHKTLQATDRPTLHLSFHENQELPGGLVRKILVKDVGLTRGRGLATSLKVRRGRQ